jgi:hypothetical protein
VQNKVDGREAPKKPEEEAGGRKAKITWPIGEREKSVRMRVRDSFGK